MIQPNKSSIDHAPGITHINRDVDESKLYKVEKTTIINIRKRDEPRPGIILVDENDFGTVWAYDDEAARDSHFTEIESKPEVSAAIAANGSKVAARKQEDADRLK